MRTGTSATERFAIPLGIRQKKDDQLLDYSNGARQAYPVHNMKARGRTFDVSN
jgi:hypothetical protein